MALVKSMNVDPEILKETHGDHDEMAMRMRAFEATHN